MKRSAVCKYTRSWSNILNTQKKWLVPPILLKISQFFAVLTHNPNAERILLLMQRRWTKEIRSTLGRSEGYYSCSTVSKKFLLLISIPSWKAMYKFVLNKSHLQRSMNGRVRKKTWELAKYDTLCVCVCVCVCVCIVHFFFLSRCRRVKRTRDAPLVLRRTLEGWTIGEGSQKLCDKLWKV